MSTLPLINLTFDGNFVFIQLLVLLLVEVEAAVEKKPGFS